MDSAVKYKAYTATSRICTLNKHLITIPVILILAVLGHRFRNSNAGPLHGAGDASGESVIQFLTLCRCSFLVHGHLEALAWQSCCVGNRPGKPGTCGSLCQASRTLTIHWTPCQSWPCEAVRSKVKGKVSPSTGTEQRLKIFFERR